MSDAHAPVCSPALVPFVYREDFESGEVRAWSSYPPCQDTAYDPFLFPGRIRPGDRSICLISMNYPPWNEDQLVGAVKLLDLVLDRAFRLRFRFFLKTTNACSLLDVQFPLASGERLKWATECPPCNRWKEIAIGWEELAAHNPFLDTREHVRITALVIQALVPKADPDMPIYLGIDDIELAAKREACFLIGIPETTKLPEWPEHIPLRHVRAGGTFEIIGRSEVEVDRLTTRITPFDDPETVLFEAEFVPAGEVRWKVDAGPFRELGLLAGAIAGYEGEELRFRTPFTLFVAPGGDATAHPRVLWDADDVGRLRERMRSKRFRPVRERFIRESRELRDRVGVDTRIYDFDQFPDKSWIASLWNWFTDRMILYREALFTNAVVYSLLDDIEAGEFCRRFLLMMAGWPQWNHPWMENRGFHTYFPLAECADAYAIAYDLIRDILTPDERKTMCAALVEKFIRPAFRTYVEWNQITANSSNWISHIAGGALDSLAAIYGDDPEYGDLEPWLTGFLLKERRYIATVFGADGSYGEGYRYYSFAMQSFARTIPAVGRVFGVDLGGPMEGSWRETLWSGIVRSNIAFTFGDSERYLKKEAQAYWIGGEAGPFNSWAWLLARTRDPHLSWLYHRVKEFDTLQEVLHETDDIPGEEPDRLGGVRFFCDVGTAVFKSGWGEDDFVFVFRSGPFFNHQHMDQGSFALADHGRVFIEERYDGEHHYYDDPLYQSHAIQTVSHNTILINRNPQSQKTGDPAGFAAGMRDQAVFGDHLDVPEYAFAAGDLAGVYRGKVEKLRRNALYLKPRTILIVDEIVPAAEDVEANLLFHTREKRDIVPRDGFTVFHPGGPSLYLYHLEPPGGQREVLTDPHFLCQYREPNLIERGCLMVSAPTRGGALVMAHLLTATFDGSAPEVKPLKREGSVEVEVHVDRFSGVVAVRTAEKPLVLRGWETDARIMAISDATGAVFLAGVRMLSCGEQTLLRSESPLTACVVETPGALSIVCFADTPTAVSILGGKRVSGIMLNGKCREDSGAGHDGETTNLLLGHGESRIECERGNSGRA